MSATNRGSERRESDFYPTPEGPVKSLMAELKPYADSLRWGEPCEGDGSIIKHTGFPWWETAELSRDRDYLKDGLTGKVDAIITNSPFTLAQEFIDRSLREADFVAYLLRLNFLGSQKRKEWWQDKEPTHLFTLAERPAFVSICKGTKGKKGCGKIYPLGTQGKCECGGDIGKGTDATEYAWFVWDSIDLCKRSPGIYII